MNSEFNQETMCYFRKTPITNLLNSGSRGPEETTIRKKKEFIILTNISLSIIKRELPRALEKTHYYQKRGQNMDFLYC